MTNALFHVPYLRVVENETSVSLFSFAEYIIFMHVFGILV